MMTICVHIRCLKVKTAWREHIVSKSFYTQTYPLPLCYTRNMLRTTESISDIPTHTLSCLGFAMNKLLRLKKLHHRKPRDTEREAVIPPNACYIISPASLHNVTKIYTNIYVKVSQKDCNNRTAHFSVQICEIRVHLSPIQFINHGDVLAQLSDYTRSLNGKLTVFQQAI